MVTQAEGLSDEALIAQLRERNTQAFGMLYDRHSRVAFGLAYRMLGDPSAAEDIVQEAFLSLWRQAESFQPERAAARTWLLSIVHHRAIDRLRRASTREEVPEAAVEGTQDQVDESIDVEHQVGVSLDAEQVRKALGSLPTDQRHAIELAYFGGLSHSEIARKLGVPIGTVKGRLRIGLQKMRALLDQAGFQGAVHDA
jgi:RNA polymerase sigma-70 factor (ECF subfamily)